ncbi:reductive dehalogenase [Dehalobacter sp. 14DCB1]|uniref:reductive dehalogenase n=1 Tax=Dehalobacter sp. 14DCB1 TaxID=2070227 RepID=UPI00036FA3C7|nr:reductive dehalogenase [Dehalobacter sp. 14DCB1]TCX51675.1 reductive dehalogenase [Dehalobacter sp. 14DCB1]
MLDSIESKKESEKKFQVGRRGFLKAGAAAAAMGVLGAIKAPAKIAEAATVNKFDYTSPSKGQWSKLRPEVNYGGASVKYAEYNDQWLGTSKIVGTVKNVSEKDMGFSLSAQGLLGEKSQKGLFQPRYPLGKALSFTMKFIGGDIAVAGAPAPEKLPIPDPEQMSKHIKDLAYYLRADEVGIGKMPEFAYYSHQMDPQLFGSAFKLPIGEIPVTERMPYVIVVAVEQHLETYLASTGYDGIANSQSSRCYHATANISVIIAQYIRNLGYNARASHFANYLVVVPPAAIAAGMGELAKVGDCAAHPRMGFRNKMAVITTDLPLVPDQPIDFGMQDFCRVCNKCADNCPAGAITHDRDYVEHNGYLRWDSDFKKCSIFRTANEEGYFCGRCVKVCPWSSKEDSWFHEAGVWIGSHGESSASFLKSIDDIFGYGTEEIEKYKWWLEWPELYKIKM